MKRLFKKLLVPTLVGFGITQLASCSKPAIEETGSIEILSSIDDVTVTESDDHKSQPVEVKCIGPDKQELNYEFVLEQKGTNTKPKWISMSEHGEILLTGEKPVGTYTFTLSAKNDKEKLYSDAKTFNVNVINNRHIAPTSLSLDIEDDSYCMYGESSTIPLTITPSKEGVEEKYLINDVNCYVYVVSGKYAQDLYGDDLFSLENNTLSISEATDESYTGKYKLLIAAVSAADSSVYTHKTITLNIDNIYQQYDATSKCTFTRSNSKQGWTLSKMDSNATRILHLPDTIQNKPIVEIAQNLCEISGIKQMVEVILPQSVYKIGNNAFANQGCLCLVEMPGVKIVGNSAFENCSIMEYKIKGNYPNFQVIGNNAFSNCKMLKIDEHKDLMWIGENACNNAGFSRFSIGKNCLYLGAGCLANCKDLKYFKIETIDPPLVGGSLFTNSDLLKSIKVPLESVLDYKLDISWSNQGKTIEGI